MKGINMQRLIISDITLRSSKDSAYSFKEKIEIVRQLDNVGVDIIETAPITNTKTDVLFLHTIAPIVKNSIISCPVGLTKESLAIAWNAIKNARRPRLHVMIPTSTVQLEYICHKKPNAAFDLVKQLVSEAKSLCADVEFSALDATRSESEFLCSMISAAVTAGATTVTLCDTAGTMLPDEFAKFVNDAYESVPALKNINLAVECSDSMNMGVACSIASVNAGACQIKTCVGFQDAPSLEAVAYMLKMRGDSLGVSNSLNQTVISRTISGISSFTDSRKSKGGIDAASVNDATQEISVSSKDDIKTVAEAVRMLGYELNEEDTAKVYENVQRVATKKPLGAKELDAIVASSAMQVAPTYTLKSYVINSGNIITATANIDLEKNGATVSGISTGDGPIDAAFRAIEQIVGHHYELDDFQIQSVTEGREAMGEALVRLRANGKLYSGKGVSTDIIGASVRAYINALNKICFEQ